MSGPAISSTAFAGLRRFHASIRSITPFSRLSRPTNRHTTAPRRDVPFVPELLPFVPVGRAEPRDVDGVRQKVHAPGRHAGGDRFALERVRDAGEGVGAPVRADDGPRQHGGVE